MVFLNQRVKWETLSYFYNLKSNKENVLNQRMSVWNTVIVKVEQIEKQKDNLSKKLT